MRGMNLQPRAEAAGKILHYCPLNDFSDGKIRALGMFLVQKGGCNPNLIGYFDGGLSISSGGTPVRAALSLGGLRSVARDARVSQNCKDIRRTLHPQAVDLLHASQRPMGECLLKIASRNVPIGGGELQVALVSLVLEGFSSDLVEGFTCPALDVLPNGVEHGHASLDVG